MFDSHTADQFGRLDLWGDHLSYKEDRAGSDSQVAYQGALDQRQDRLNGIEKTIGSSPISSTISRQSSKVGILVFTQDNASSNLVCRSNIPPPLDADSALRTLMKSFDYFRGCHGPRRDDILVF